MYLLHINQSYLSIGVWLQ